MSEALYNVLFGGVAELPQGSRTAGRVDKGCLGRCLNHERSSLHDRVGHFNIDSDSV